MSTIASTVTSRVLKHAILALGVTLVVSWPEPARPADPDWKAVNPVARTLRQHGIDVTALHNHGLLDVPRLFYIHFWANDDPARLAQGLKAALDRTNRQK